MTKEDFLQALEAQADLLSEMRYSAHSLHASVNQTYGQNHPYGYHLDMVAEGVRRYAHAVCAEEADVLPLMFGAYFHDSIEDARQTYNDTLRTARQYMTEQQALLAAEIVYALTNDKGRSRSERAGDHYYQGIRQTPYAPLVKLADRLANTTYSCRTDDESNHHMLDVYRREMPHFLQSITVPDNDDIRYQLPKEMVEDLKALV